MATHASTYPYRKPRNQRAVLNIWLGMAALIVVITLCTGTFAGGLPSLTFATLLSALQDLFSSLLFSTAALLAMLYAVTRLIPQRTDPAGSAHSSTQSNTQAHARPHAANGYTSPFPSFGQTSPQAGQNGRAAGPNRQAYQQTASHTYQQTQRPLPPAPAVPSSLVQHAETLLTRARTIPNFNTTPLAGQHRVLTKLAANFVPPAQRHAAVTLAVFRLRQPTSSTPKAA